jgi:hypothetical protein
MRYAAKCFQRSKSAEPPPGKYLEITAPINCQWSLALPGGRFLLVSLCYRDAFILSGAALFAF